MCRGDRVRVYEDPLSRRRLEGIATLVSLHEKVGAGCERWYVRFLREEGQVLRTVWESDTEGGTN